eukprot:TRINITY_DN44474_c0_g1_i2.p1 TRINITY_DN44474_c0_g1~~TRINITY_DN44474_c0_g1_i2.p1  ORF type:complete len:155 (-),score=39.52 TRINITY_DN44474_c0_g1_i2:86-550(-)
MPREKRARKASGGKDVREWLETIQLHNYADQLLQCKDLSGKTGIDVFKGLVKLEDLGLRHFGVSKSGHRCKIRYYARKALHDQGMLPEREEDRSVTPVGSESEDESQDEDEKAIVMPDDHPVDELDAKPNPGTQRVRDFLNALDLDHMLSLIHI